MRLPILYNHDLQRVIGRFLYDVSTHRHYVVFTPFTVNMFMLQSAQTGWGFRIVEQAEKDGVTYVHKIELLEISL